MTSIGLSSQQTDSTHKASCQLPGTHRRAGPVSLPLGSACALHAVAGLALPSPDVCLSLPEEASWALQDPLAQVSSESSNSLCGGEGSL